MLRRTLTLTVASFALAASATVLAPRDAAACGGCFHGEPSTPKPGTTQSPSVVTDHRMAIALSPTMTTLWDQIEYAGDPEEFAWVLPVRGAVVVGLGNDDFLTALDSQTQLEINAPRRRCSTPRNNGCGGSGTAGCGSADEATEDIDIGYQEDAGIFVTGRSVVGPYATVQVHGSDEGAIVGWLRAHKYAVPKDIEPILAKYVDEGFDFVAVRLRPTAGVRAMVPIRVSWKGASAALPLRMVRAGVGAKVGLKLFVIGDGRWKTKNFPTFSVDPSGLSWDFNNQRSDYVTVRDSMAGAFGGRAFALESSLDLLRSSLPSVRPMPFPEEDAGEPMVDSGADTAVADSAVADTAVADTAEADGGAADGDVDASEDTAIALDTGTDAPSVVDAATDTAKPTYDAGKPPSVDPYASDVEIAFGTYAQRRVTRLRADLPVAFLDQDLELEADENQAVLSRKIQITRASTAVVCPGAASIARAGEEDDGAPVRVGLGLGLAAIGAILARRASRRA